MNHIKLTLSIFLLATLVIPAAIVYANVPTIITITRRTDGGNTIVDVKVSHTDSTTSHYISQVSLDLDGTIKSFIDLPKATTVEATYILNIGTTSPKTIKAQAVCNIHGPSSWSTEGETGNTGGSVPSGGSIPSYPTEAIIAGILTALAAATILYRKH
jgi:desulfoferrodoxin (superoxide reductase-like protein)